MVIVGGFGSIIGFYFGVVLIFFVLGIVNGFVVLLSDWLGM